MPPSPSFHHQSHASRILNFFAEVWEPRTGGAAVMQVNVSTAERRDQDYRIPDVSVMLSERVPQGEVMFVRPNVGVEVRTESVDRGSTLHLRLRGEPETDRGI